MNKLNTMELDASTSVEGAPRASLTVQVVTFFGVVVPFLGVVAVPFLLWGWGFGWTDFGLLVGMYVLTVLGVSIGFHRLLVHRSFETYAWVKVFWTIIGSMAVQGSLFNWVGMHRRHHQYSDTEKDPHTPHGHGGGILGFLRGLWHAHLGWLFRASPDLERYISDIRSSRAMRVVSNLFPLWTALGLLIPAILGGLITMSWVGALTGLIWGGLVRIFLVHHVTWSVNSACHLWGFRPWKNNDESRDNPVLGILALGEGWHASHHAFPTSARHGLGWWKIDISYWVIRGSHTLLRLAWNLRVPTREALARLRRRA